MDLRKLLFITFAVAVLSSWIGYKAGAYLWAVAKDFLTLKVSAPPIPSVPSVNFSGDKESSFGAKDFMALLPKIEPPLPQEVVQELPQEKPQTPPPKLRVTTIVISKERVAVIEGRLFKEGDVIHSGERIVKITRDGVLLEGRWGRRWVYIER